MPHYDFFPLPGANCEPSGSERGRWGILIADVSGHGSPATVLMAITHALAHAKPRVHTPPAMLLGYLNDRLTHAYTRNGTFVTAFYAVLDSHERTLTYSRAGHNPPRVLRGNQVLSIDGLGGLPLGILEKQAYSESTLKLESGDLLLLYTDGITEAVAPLQKGAERKRFEVERLDEVLLGCTGSTADQCIARIRAAVSAFTENGQPTDDQTLIAIRCL